MDKDMISKRFHFGGVDYEYFGFEGEIQFPQTPWYEGALLNYLWGLKKEGVYIDVGGNMGNHSLFFINHCKATKLYTFEPEENCHAVVKKNLETNATKEYKLFNMAAWDKKTALKLIRFESFLNTGQSQVVEAEDGDTPADTLDNLIPPDDKVVMIKIDVEGSEPQVLRGGINLIKKHKPVIICETATDQEFQRVDDILVELGYKTPWLRWNATPTYVWEI